MPTALVAGVGISFIMVVIAAITVISINLKDFYNAPLQGTILMTMEEGQESNVVTTLTTSYWLACATGPMLLILAILRRFIFRKNNT